MARYYTPLVTAGALTAAALNSRLQELDNALFNGLEWRSFNIKNYPYNGVGNDFVNDYTALQNAANDAIDWSMGTARGGLVEIPAGVYRYDQPLDLSGAVNVRLLGTNAVWSAVSYGASVLKPMFNNDVAVDVSSSDNLTLEKLTIGGQGGTNLAYDAVYGSTARMLRLYELNIDNFGGHAILVEQGIGKIIRDIQTTNCMKGFADLGARAGVVQLTGGENYFYRGNINGPGDFGHVAGVLPVGLYGSGYLAAVYVTSAPIYMEGTVMAFAQHGGIFTGGGSASQMLGIRAEFIQGDGIIVEGDQYDFSLPEFVQVGHAADNTYYGIKFNGDGATQNCLVAPGIYAPPTAVNQARALLFDNVNSPWGIQSANRVIAPKFGFSNKSNVNGWVNKTGTNFLEVVGGIPTHQTLVDGATVNINAALGDLWDLSAGGSRTIAAPTMGYKGQRAVLSFKNNTGGAIVTTWNAAFKMAGWVEPAAGKTRKLQLECYDGTNWAMTADVTGDLTI